MLIITSVCQALINRRYSEIDKREKLVTQEIKTFAVKLITEINRRGKKLLTDLNSVCGAKMRQLGLKHSEILALATRLGHTLKFAEYAMDHGGSSAVLHSKKALVNQLKTVLRTRCEVPNPYHVVDIRMKYDLRTISAALQRQGALLVDGIPYNGLPASPGTQAAQMAAMRTPGSSTQLSSSATRMPPNFSNLTPDQRAALMHRLAKMAQQQGKAVPGAVGSHMGLATPPAYVQQLSAQSSMVSSSNHKAGYHPSLGRAQPSMINLAQLQEKRRMQHAMQSVAAAGATSPGNQTQPIVIQPSSPPHPYNQGKHIIYNQI